MPRPRRGRRICVHPAYERFSPEGCPGGEAVVLLLEEYECIRSIDHDGLKQEECARRMDISRTTVAEIYAAARYKLAESLVHGRPLVIEGGCYRLCDFSAPCGKCCPRAEGRPGYCVSLPVEKGEGKMRIAVPYENGQVFQHFGHAQEFKLYDIGQDAVEKAEVISAAGSGHGALATLLADNGVDALICGGIGAGAIQALGEAGIRVHAGVKGAADEAVEAYLAGTLVYTEEANCDHHGKGHHHHGDGQGEGHSAHHRHGESHEHGQGEGRCPHRGQGGHGHGGPGGHGGHGGPGGQGGPGGHGRHGQGGQGEGAAQGEGRCPHRGQGKGGHHGHGRGQG